MSIRNLQQSFEDRDRVPKIQGLLNELMTFLEDDLSALTGAYDEVLSLDEVIEKELILFVSLNTNKNSKARNGSRPDAPAEHAANHREAV